MPHCSRLKWRHINGFNFILIVRFLDRLNDFRFLSLSKDRLRRITMNVKIMKKLSIIIASAALMMFSVGCDKIDINNTHKPYTPTVAQPSSKEDTNERRDGNGDGGQWTCTRHWDVQTLGKKRRQPILCRPSWKTRSSKEKQDDPKSPCGKHDTKSLEQRTSLGVRC